MFFWRRVAPQVPEDGLKPTATPGYTRNFRDLNDLVSRGKSFSGYERNSLFLNERGKGFADVAKLLDVDFDDDARAVASVDWDRDGDLDLWVTNRTAPQVRLLKNNQPSSGSFLSIRLIGNGKTTNRDAIGARLTLSSSSQNKQLRTVRAGDGFLAQSSFWTHFGLGNDKQNLTLAVSWPGGKTQTFADLKAGRHYTITQGAAEAEEWSPPHGTPQTVLDNSAGRASRPIRNGVWVANPLPFPALSLADETGSTKSTTGYLGQPLLVNLWATWCGPCVEELTMFAEHADELSELDVNVLALNVDEHSLNADEKAATKNVRQLLDRVGYKLPLGFAQRDNLAKVEVLIQYLTSRRAPLSIPSSFLVDASGKVAAIYLEPVRWEQLAADVATLKGNSLQRLAQASPRPGRWLADPREAIDYATYVTDYATLFATNGFPKESQRLYEQIHQAGKGKDATAYYNQAKAAAQQGQRQKAIDLYQTAIDIDPQYGQALTGLGALLLVDKRVNEAERLFERALKIDPNHATALVNLAMIDQSRGDRDKALERLRTVVGRNPGFAQAQSNLGSLLASMKRYEEAIPCLMKALEVRPTMLPAQMNLAFAYTKTKQWALAEETYRIAQQINPKEAYSHFGLGQVLAAQQRDDEAVASYRTAISLGYDKAVTFVGLGHSHLRLGRKQDAIAAFRKAIEQDPKNVEARRGLEIAESN